jgi:hypothetical protein
MARWLTFMHSSHCPWPADLESWAHTPTAFPFLRSFPSISAPASRACPAKYKKTRGQEAVKTQASNCPPWQIPVDPRRSTASGMVNHCSPLLCFLNDIDAISAESAPPKDSVSGYDIVRAVRTFGSEIGAFKTLRFYIDGSYRLPPPLASELQCSGVTIVNTMSGGRQGSASKMLLGMRHLDMFVALN